MADTFGVFYLGNFASLDPTEGNNTAENAGALVNQTFGSATDPLYDDLQELSPGSTGYGNDTAGVYSSDNYLGFLQQPDSFRIDDGADQIFDTIVTYTATITYANGLPPVVVTAIIIQDTNGNLYLAPAPTSNSYQAALEAGPLESIQINSVVTDTSNFSGSRVDGNYVQPDGWVDGTTGNDNMTETYVDTQADEIDQNANAINAGSGDDTVNAGGGNDTILGGAGSDVINGGSGNDVIRGDSSLGTQTTYSWANQGISDGTSITGGITGNAASGDIRVAMTIQQEQNFNSATMERTDPLYNYNSANDSSSIRLQGGAPGSDVNSVTMTIDFSSLNSTVSDEVAKVSFGIFDLDQAAGFKDEVFIRAYDANGNLIPVDLTAGNTDTILVDDATGRAVTTGAGEGLTDSKTGFLQVEIAGPVARIEIDYNNIDPGDANHAINVGDLQFTTITVNDIGNDTIDGGDGNDTLFGEAGNDSLTGGTGNDSISGGTGNDTIAGGTGDDTMSGGDGADRFVMEDSFGTDVITGGEGGTDTDTLTFSTLSSGVTLNYSGAEAGTVTNGANSLSFSQIENTVLTSSADTVNAVAGGVTLDTGGGNDTITVGSGVYNINAGDGDDTIIRNTLPTAGDVGSVIDGGSGTDTYVAGSGLGAATINLENNQLEYLGQSHGTLLNFENVSLVDSSASVIGDAGNNVITATGNFDNVLFGGGGDDYIDAGGGNDSLDGGTGNDTLLGGDGNDTLLGGDGADSLAGGIGNDSLSGGIGNDTLLGDDGNDTLDGGTGNDVLTGGAGDDTFVYSGGNDQITDFNTGNTGALNDGIETNNDFIDLGTYYGNIFDLRADFADDGILNQSNFATTDYTGKTQFAGGSLEFFGVSASGLTTDNTGVICFGEGAAIRTPSGDVLVQDLKVGDLVTTMDNGPQRIRWINRRSYDAAALEQHEHLRPVVIRRGVFGAERNFIVSQQHGILTGRNDDHFARAKHLAECTRGVRIAHGKKQVTYIHLMFESHQVIFAENVPSESFFPGPMALKAMQRHDRKAFSKVLPGLGRGAVTRAQVVDVYGQTARKFIGRSALLAAHNIVPTPKPAQIKIPSAKLIQASAELVQSGFGRKALINAPIHLASAG